VTPGTARPATARPAPHFKPAPARIPRDPAARDHSWPDQWPLRAHLELAALVTAPGSARAHVAAVLQEWQADADTADVAALVVTELLTNAIQTTQKHHLHDPVRMWMLGERASLLFLVWDATDPAPVLAPATPDKDEHGRGLEIVNALCHYLRNRRRRGILRWPRPGHGGSDDRQERVWCPLASGPGRRLREVAGMPA
jgi:anti-sigma regulatory factor (Ser/Thr protein kinase)